MGSQRHMMAELMARVAENRSQIMPRRCPRFYENSSGWTNYAGDHRKTYESMSHTHKRVCMLLFWLSHYPIGYSYTVFTPLLEKSVSHGISINTVMKGFHDYGFTKTYDGRTDGGSIDLTERGIIFLYDSGYLIWADIIENGLDALWRKCLFYNESQ